jgi:hypothetical protein
LDGPLLFFEVEMDKVELMVKKVGDEWCLFTQDGSRKLGCHPTEKEAYAQEAAIKHSMGEAESLVDPTLAGADRENALASIAFALAVSRAKALADLSFHRINLGEISIAPGSFEILPNGDVIKSIPLAGLGEEFINGPQKFSMTPKLVAEGIANFQADGSNPIPVYIGHNHTSSTPAAGWINDITQGEDGAPWGKLQFLKDTWDAITKGLYKYFSLEFYEQGLDRQGKNIGFQFDGGAILNNPFFPIRVDQGRRRGAGVCFALSRFSSEPTAADDGRDQGAATMSETATTAAAASTTATAAARQEPVVAGDRVTLSKAQFDGLLADKAEAARLKIELEAERAKGQTNEARITNLERSTQAGKIRRAIDRMQSQHGVVLQLGDFAIDSSDAECLAWLATCPFGVSTVDGLEKLARDEESCAHLPRIPLSKERGGGTNAAVPVDLSSEAGRNAAVQAEMVRVRRTYKADEIDLMLTRTHQTLEEFVRKDLAADHPEHAKHLLDRK